MGRSEGASRLPRQPGRARQAPAAVGLGRPRGEAGRRPAAAGRRREGRDPPADRGPGPGFLVYRNYDAIYSYNAAESYALAIALLSDRLRGGSGLVASWPTDDPGISRLERKQLQKALLARGYDIGEADGLIGTSTRKAIQAEQKRLGLTPADGRAGRNILGR